MSSHLKESATSVSDPGSAEGSKLFASVKRNFLSLVRGTRGSNDSAGTHPAYRNNGKGKQTDIIVTVEPDMVSSPLPRAASSRVSPSPAPTSKQTSSTSVYSLFPHTLYPKPTSIGGTTAAESERTRVVSHIPTPLNDKEEEPEEDYFALAHRYRDTMARVSTRSGDTNPNPVSPVSTPLIGPSRKKAHASKEPDRESVMPTPNMERILLTNVTLYRPRQPAKVPGVMDLNSPTATVESHGLLVHFALANEMFEFNPAAPPSPEIFRMLEKREITRRFKQLVGFEGDAELEEISEWALLNSLKRSTKKTRRKGSKWIARDEGRRMWLAGVGDLMTCAVYVRG